MDGGEGSADKTIINRIMLRFRPIAPKPAAGSQAAEPRANVFVGVGRKKRRYVRVSSSAKRTGKSSGSVKDGLKTLRLLPDESAHGGKEELPVKERDPEPSDLTVDDEIRRPRATEASRLTVLSVTNACMGEAGLTDEERWRDLEADTCPGFISDGRNHVVWSNAAYEKMVGGEGGVAIEVGDKIRLPVSTCPAFSCMVKMQYTWQEGTKTLVVPCDVWRMNNGGLAWRLDPKAGLSLSLGL